MWKDPIVEEVRKTREKLAKMCDYDIKKMAKMIKQGEKRSKKLGWKFVSPSQNKQKLVK